MLIWTAALLITRSISKKKLSNFRHYIEENLPDMDLNRDSVLIAKQASKWIRPDIGLLINDPQRDIIILQDIKGSGITHHRYNYEE